MKENTHLSIKDFSKFTGIKQSTLRYYDEIGLLPPESRGDNNYRYYLPYQIIILNFINVLIDLGVPLSTIKDMVHERTPESVIDLLSKQEEKLDVKLKELQMAYSIIHTFRGNIQAGLAADSGEITVVEMDAMSIVLGPENDFENKPSFYLPFIDFCNMAQEYRINLRYPIGGYHYDMDSFIKKTGQPDRFFSQDPTGNLVREAGRYLTAYKYGYYGQFDDTPLQMCAYAEERGFEFTGPVYVMYLLDEISIVEPEKYLSRITVMVSDRPKQRIK